MIAVYSDSVILDREWIPFIDFKDEIVVYSDLQKYLADPAPKKVAFTAHRLHCEHDQDMLFEHKVRSLSAHSIAVFCLESELHHFHWQIWNYCHSSNVHWLLPGRVNDNPDMNSHIIYWGDWMKTTSALYKKLPTVLEQLNPYSVKPKMFDALLGSPKPHRTFVANMVQQHQLQEQFVLTYGGKWKNDSFYAEDYFIWEPGCEVVDQLIGTCDWVRYHGHQCHLSQVIPVDVFNQTAYSVVAETDHDNTLSFFSEKTAKVMIARRLFVAFSGYKFLHNLRELGFKTFDCVIDESYDAIKKDHDRYSAAFDQIRWLCNQPQQEILDKVRPVLEHNYELIMNTDWNKRSIDQVQAQISTHD